jgi:hypothetical protein
MPGGDRPPITPPAWHADDETAEHSEPFVPRFRESEGRRSVWVCGLADRLDDEVSWLRQAAGWLTQLHAGGYPPTVNLRPGDDWPDTLTSPPCWTASPATPECAIRWVNALVHPTGLGCGSAEVGIKVGLT